MGSRLEHVIARNVTELRAGKGATQNDLAAQMRSAGFKWTTNRVAQIETLHRPVSLLEVVGLARVFVVPVSRLLAGDDDIELPTGKLMPLAEVRDALAGVDSLLREWSSDEAEDFLQSGQELRKIAAKLGLTTGGLEALADEVFGRGFRAEREARLSDVSGLSKRSAQTKRGHVSRALLAELEAAKTTEP